MKQGYMAPVFYEQLNVLVDQFNDLQARLGSPHRIERFPRQKDIDREQAINWHVKNGTLDEMDALSMTWEEQDEFLSKIPDKENI